MNITNKIIITITLLMLLPNKDIAKKNDNEVSPSGNNWQMVEFNLTNPSASPVIVDLFDVNGLATPIPSTPSSLPPTSVIAVTTVGGNTHGIAISLVSGDAYVCISTLGTVKVIDRNSYLVTATITVGTNPRGIVYNSLTNTMYVCNTASNSISVINCSTNTVIATITTGITAPIAIAYNPIDNTMYAGDGSGGIMVIDCVTNSVIATLSAGLGFYGLAHNPVTNTIYATSPNSNLVYVIDCATNTISTSISVTNCHGICYNPLTNIMYVVRLAGTVVRIDCTTNTIVGSPITVGLGTDPRPLVYNPTNNQVYVGNYLTSEITAIACSTNTVFGTITGVADPMAIAYSPASNGLFISNELGSVTVANPFQTFYITSSSFDYNQFVRDQGINPKIVRQIVLLTTASQLNNNIQILQKDMYGKRYSDYKIPNLEVSKFMNQNTIAELDFSTKKNSLIFDAYTSFSQYTINAETTLIMLIYYKEAIMAEKLNRHGKTTLGTCISMQIPNCSQDATLKLENEIPDFGEPTITLDYILTTEK